MSLIKRNPSLVGHFDPFSDLDGIFSDFFRPMTLSREENEALAMPRCDIQEKDNGYLLKVDLPGVKREDIDISVHEGVLTISAETRADEKKEEEGKVVRRERHYGQYVRRFNLGDDINHEGARASFSDGVLSLDLPRREQPRAKPVKLEVS